MGRVAGSLRWWSQTRVNTHTVRSDRRGRSGEEGWGGPFPLDVGVDLSRDVLQLLYMDDDLLCLFVRHAARD